MTICTNLADRSCRHGDGGRLLGVDRVASRPAAADARACHSPDDEEVFLEDLLVSVDRLRSRGGDVTVRRLPGLDHVNGWVQAMPRAVRYFRTLE